MFTMRMLTVAALLCTIMALTRADAETDLVKRTCRCASPWKRIKGRCFLFVSQQLSWAHAEKNCQNMGGNLASVHSYDEYCAIQRLVISRCHKNKEIWIGGHDGEEEKIWLWSDGRQFTYRNWCRGEPDNFKGIQHCLTMNHSAERCWNDADCQGKRPSVCVKRGW